MFIRRFKFCAIVMGGKREHLNKLIARFICTSWSELVEPDKWFAMTGKDFALVNPNTGTAPFFEQGAMLN